MQCSGGSSACASASVYWPFVYSTENVSELSCTGAGSPCSAMRHYFVQGMGSGFSTDCQTDCGLVFCGDSFTTYCDDLGACGPCSGTFNIDSSFYVHFARM